MQRFFFNAQGSGICWWIFASCTIFFVPTSLCCVCCVRCAVFKVFERTVNQQSCLANPWGVVGQAERVPLQRGGGSPVLYAKHQMFFRPRIKPPKGVISGPPPEASSKYFVQVSPANLQQFSYIPWSSTTPGKQAKRQLLLAS